jgi:hypothetical protein
MNGEFDDRNRNPGAYCPSCERYIGPADVCPYCDADSAKNPALNVLKYGAVLLALTGLAFLYFMTTCRQLPVLKIAGITPMMNFAMVRVNGTVEKDAYVSGRKGRVESVSFTIDDGSGRLRMTAYGTVAQAVVDGEKVPSRGSKVDVTGSLNVAADGNVKLVLRSADELRIAEYARH